MNVKARLLAIKLTEKKKENLGLFEKIDVKIEIRKMIKEINTTENNY